jgi:hypothetical protein
LGLDGPGLSGSDGVLVLASMFFRYSKLEVAETPHPLHTKMRGIRGLEVGRWDERGQMLGGQACVR